MRVVIQNKGLANIDTKAIVTAAMLLEKPRGRSSITRALIGTHEGLFLCHVNFNHRRIIVISKQADAVPSKATPTKKTKTKPKKNKAAKKPKGKNEPEATIETLTKKGKIRRNGAWYYYKGNKYLGMKRLIEAFL